MRRFNILSLMAIALFSLTSCQAVETIFKAGMWWGIILVVGVVGFIMWLFGKAKK